MKISTHLFLIIGIGLLSTTLALLSLGLSPVIAVPFGLLVVMSLSSIFFTSQFSDLQPLSAWRTMNDAFYTGGHKPAREHTGGQVGKLISMMHVAGRVIARRGHKQWQQSTRAVAISSS